MSRYAMRGLPDNYRSRYDVARHLGVMVERRPGRREPEDVDMADEDVAALLMSLPMGNGSAACHLRPPAGEQLPDSRHKIASYGQSLLYSTEQ